MLPDPTAVVRSEARACSHTSTSTRCDTDGAGIRVSTPGGSGAGRTVTPSAGKCAARSVADTTSSVASRAQDAASDGHAVPSDQGSQ